MVNLEELIINSRCFGIAYSSKAKECKACKAYTECKKYFKEQNSEADKPELINVATIDEVTLSEINTIEKPKQTVKSLTEKKYDPTMPNFKELDINSIENLIISRGGELSEFESYKGNMRRMRMVVWLKKTYEV